ncbi:MAG TPA: hypothetical protein DCQ30_08855 [Acidimicrobiaceae bacterium]|nr:hypothetical protein [Acidimicrobiaceae bacterium]
MPGSDRSVYVLPRRMWRAGLGALGIRRDALAVRRRFAAALTGHGVELGAGHSPFPVPNGVVVRYVDRWEPEENRALFPELADGLGFLRPDIVSDLDAERLSAIPDGSEDFVIASHILEHLANPLKMLAEIHRVLRDGGLFVLVLPDRHTTFDAERPPTTVEHLYDEFQRDVREVPDDHVAEAIVAQVRYNGDRRHPGALRAELTALEVETHRRRSIHAHVWDMDEFGQVLRFAEDELGVGWTVVDTMSPGARGSHANEFGWLLSRRG